ncbi:hypothetical protein AMTRI_Chr02g217520 [Amborella trichopoda]
MLPGDYCMALIQALSRLEVYETEVERIEVDPKILNNCMIVTFSDDDLHLSEKFHNHPLFVTGELHAHPISQIMLDGGSAVNLIPRRVLTRIGLGPEDLTPTTLTVQGFNQSGEKPTSTIRLHLKSGDLNEYAQFHVIEKDISYNVLLGHPWMHDQGVVPSTLHQCFKYSQDGRQYTIYTNKKPFPIAKIHHVDEKYYFANLEFPQEIVTAAEADNARKAEGSSHDDADDVHRTLLGMFQEEAKNGKILPLT